MPYTMDKQSLYVFVWGILVFTSVIIMIRSIKKSVTLGNATKMSRKAALDIPKPVRGVVDALRSALPQDVVLTHDATSHLSTEGHWALQECEETPACIIQPRDREQVASVIKVLSGVHTEQTQPHGMVPAAVSFAVRGGGHSAVSGAASIKGGVLIDLGRLNKVKLSEDKRSVTIGGGARWTDVSTLLDQETLAAVGGRNSHVGVGGLTLGGGISWFSPQFGFVCSNVVEYEIILASGEVTTASASTNSDLWRALKGGANNFGVITQFTVRCFPSSKIWAGFLYLPSFQSDKVLAAFHQSVKRADPGGASFSKYAAGPIACFTYLQALNLQVISVNLVYTALPEEKTKWPTYWKSSSFASLWWFWSTCKVRTLTDATDEMNALNPPGRRQVLAATTIRNDTTTLAAAHRAFKNAISSIRRVKGISWTLVMQPLVPEWARKGDPNPLGLDEGDSEPLVIVSLTVNWADAKDDEFAKSETRRVVEEIEAFADAHGTAHRYRYLNYCDDWQDPFRGYGEENRRFLQEVSKKYDSGGLFQQVCAGGFKLWE